MAIGRKGLLGALLGLVLALGLASGLGAQQALAVDETYTLKVKGEVDSSYVLGTSKTLSFEVPQGTKSITIGTVPAEAGNIVSNPTADWAEGQDSAKVTYSVNGPGECVFYIHCLDSLDVTIKEVGVHVECTKNSSDIPVESVTLDKEKADLEVGDTLQLKATVKPDGATHPDLDWKSDDVSVAEVDSLGNVKAVADGTTTITVYSLYYPSVTATCKVTVKKPVPVESVTLDQTSAELNVGGTLQLNATVSPKDATHPDLDWSSSDESVATVDGAGIVTAVADGTATITVKSTDGTGKSATCKVTVAKEAEKGSYSATAGDGSTWTKGSSDPLTFTFKNSVDDSKTYKAFKGAKVDGADVPESAMATAEGSLVLSLTTTYLETLSVGEHKLTVSFEDGEATATFTVKAAETKAAASSSKSPKTGDGTPVALLATCAALSAVVLLASRTRLRKPGRIGRHAR